MPVGRFGPVDGGKSMTAWEWDDSLSMHIEEIDEQHKHAFELLGEVRQAMRERMERRICIKRMEMLRDYLSTHFAVEERLMHEYGYPRLIEHKRQHCDTMSTMNLICERMKNERAIITFETFDDMAVRMHDHVVRYDQRYAPFVRQSGERRLPPPIRPIEPPQINA